MERRDPELGRGLAWLVGMDWNDTAEADSPEQMVQQRMLAHRRLPVGIPEVNRAPQDVSSPYRDGTEQR